jgi:2-keto-4-pentenoate hydratase/2-oxohepta-3-ene-1,7-dioic acid hydratase in catechol pathway
MIVRIPEIVEYIQKTISVAPGDLLLTGTPAGTAAEMVDPRWLEPGQRVRVEIDGLGSIENTIVAPTEN